jgi:hypothetical protein
MSHTLPVGTIRGTAQAYVYAPNTLDWPGPALSVVHPAPEDCKGVKCNGMENTECQLVDIYGASANTDCKAVFPTGTLEECNKRFTKGSNGYELCNQCHTCSCCNQCQSTGVNPDCVLAAIAAPPTSGTW